MSEESAQTAGKQEDVEFINASGGYKIEFRDVNESRLRILVELASDVTVSHFRTEFRISARWILTDCMNNLRERVKRDSRHFVSKVNSILPFEEEGRKILLVNQVAQNIKAAGSTDTSLSALYTNAAAQQGIPAALLSVADFCDGVSHLDPVTSMSLIIEEHVQCARRFVDISVMIREVFRESLEKDTDLETDDSSDDDVLEEQAVARGCNTDYYAIAAERAAPTLALEDDAQVVFDRNELGMSSGKVFTERLVLAMREVPDFDVLYLGWSGWRGGHFKLREDEDEGEVVRQVEYVWTTVAYVVSQAGAKKLLAAACPMNQPVDNFMAWEASQGRLKSFVVLDEGDDDDSWAGG